MSALIPALTQNSYDIWNKNLGAFKDPDYGEEYDIFIRLEKKDTENIPAGSYVIMNESNDNRYSLIVFLESHHK